jgi:hypothetical protein
MYQSKLFALTATWLVSGLIYMSRVQADSTGYRPPDGGGKGSTQTVPGGTMGPCDINRTNQEMPLVLVPKYQNWLTTANEHPTFWFYSPVSLSEFATVEFELEGVAPRKVFRRSLTSPSASAGITSIRLPDSEPPLEVGQPYQWKLIFTCPNGRTILSVRNSVTRIAPSPELTNELNSAKTPEAKASAYANHGVWLEALTVLGDRRRTGFSNAALNTQWTELLEDEDVALQEYVPDIAAKSILEAVQLSE